MIKCPSILHKCKQPVILSPAGISCLFVGNSVRWGQGAWGLRLTSVSHVDSHRWEGEGLWAVGWRMASPGPADPAALGRRKPELCNGSSLHLSWDFSSAPVSYPLYFLLRVIPYSFWDWSQKFWNDKKSLKRVSLILVGLGKAPEEIKQNKPKFIVNSSHLFD